MKHFIFGALCPSESGLMNKHIVKYIVSVVMRLLRIWVSGPYGSCRVNVRPVPV